MKLISPAIFVLLLPSIALVAGPAPVRAGEADVVVRYGDANGLLPQDADALLTGDRASLPPVQTDSPDRVANGVDVEIANFQDVVRIQFSDTRGRHRCSGVLLSNDTVLTAGHCGCGTDYSVSIQKAPVLKTNNEAFRDLKITKGPILFPGFQCEASDAPSPGRDLALIRLEPFVKKQDKFKIGKGLVAIKFPVIRPTAQVLSDNRLRSLYIVGFGATETGDVPRNLQGAHVGIISRNCVQGHVFLSICAAFRELALGRSREAPGLLADSCGGDSGGPAYRIDSNARVNVSVESAPVSQLSDKTLVGIVSRALAGVVHPYPGYCGGGGIYTAVGTRPVLDWLKDQHVEFLYDKDPLFASVKG